MSIRKLRNAVRRFSFFLPFTAYFVLFVLAVVASDHWLQGRTNIPDSSFKDILQLLVRICIYFAAIILSLGFFSSFIPYLVFVIRWRKGAVDLRLNSMGEDQRAAEASNRIEVFASPVLQPLLGFIRLRLKYGPSEHSEKVSLLKPFRIQWFSSKLEGIFYWKIPQIREYSIDKAIIYFEDFFQFFSFAYPIDTGERFYTPPEKERTGEISPSPRKTEENKVRIEELKRVEGEMINYKDFESHDDVRRIVWKIYARNKELVVRIPEIMDPYSSHICYYVSFYNSLPDTGNDVIELPFLNYFKTVCWSVYGELEAKGFEVRYSPDLAVATSVSGKAREQARYAITVSSWHRSKSLKDYFNKRETSVLVISSLTDPAELESLLEEVSSDLTLVYVQLSDIFKHDPVREWVKWVFLEEEKGALGAFRNKWMLSPMRLRLVQNEEKLRKVVAKHDRSKMILKEKA